MAPGRRHDANGAGTEWPKVTPPIDQTSPHQMRDTKLTKKKYFYKFIKGGINASKNLL